MSEQFCLRWNNHQSTLISVFETLLESGSLIDCTLCAEGQLLKGHKVVLSACSPIFESMLCIQEDKHPIIFLKDVKFIELKAMLDYMYKGEVNILQDQLDSFLRTAAALQIKGLTDQGGGGGDEPPAKKGPGRKTGMSDAPESPLVGNAPLREGSVSPTRRRRRLPRRPSSAEDASADNCDIPPPAVAPPAITPATQAPLPVVESLQRSSLTVKAKQEPIDTPLVTPKQEFVEETNEEIEDLTLDDDDDYNDSMSDLSKPGTSYGAMNPGSTSQQDFSQWQQMMGAADRSGTDEVFMAAQEAINNQANTQDIEEDLFRKRSPNFSLEEKMLFLTIFRNFYSAINKADIARRRRKKGMAWDEVVFEFNRQTPAGIPRDKENLRNLWENLVKRAKKPNWVDTREEATLSIVMEILRQKEQMKSVNNTNMTYGSLPGKTENTISCRNSVPEFP